MKEAEPAILVLNAGSSSIKFAVFAGSSGAEPPRREFSGSIGGIGGREPELSIAMGEGRPASTRVGAIDHAAAIGKMFEALGERGLQSFRAVGHRMVHGGPDHFEPVVVGSGLLDELRRIIAFAPEHLPQAIALIEAVGRIFPSAPQIACFDTAFHKDLPAVARTLPLPRRLMAIGVRRYGFHGLSYEYLLRELARVGRPGEARGRVILAHLGNGASMAAVRDGKSVDTTMGMTPAGGLVMSSRSGDIDPGVVRFLERHERLSPEQFNRMVNHESGLLGVSQISGDMRELIEAQSGDARAGEAVEMFCYSARKWIGAFAAALGGLDTLVFSGGIGEHQAEIRRRICRGLEFLGIELDAGLNAQNAPIIGRDGAVATVRVIPTDEESTILRAMLKILSREPENITRGAES
jgi:acetate kinase